MKVSYGLKKIEWSGLWQAGISRIWVFCMRIRISVYAENPWDFRVVSGRKKQVEKAVLDYQEFSIDEDRKRI